MSEFFSRTLRQFAQLPDEIIDKVMQPFQGKLLVSNPDQQPDPDRAREVVFIVSADHVGAVGLSLTQVSEVTSSEVLASMDNFLSGERRYPHAQFLLQGGDATPQAVFTLRPKDDKRYEPSTEAGNYVFTPSADFLNSIGKADAPEKVLLFLGARVWQENELAHEMAQKQWFVLEPDDALLFDTAPEARFDAACERLGLAANHESQQRGFHSNFACQGNA